MTPPTCLRIIPTSYSYPTTPRTYSWRCSVHTTSVWKAMGLERTGTWAHLSAILTLQFYLSVGVDGVHVCICISRLI
jgi:hypothetical protein